jgi:DNA-binding XRE family transcriptional regulator
MATIEENIKKLRIKQGLGQDDLAKKAEPQHSTLNKIEGDFVKRPIVQMAAKITKALGVSIGYLPRE